MQLYSKAEQAIMESCFSKQFDVPKEYCTAKPIQDWMETAPIGIVEYDGTLDGETSYQRDRRMEMMDVYDGNIKSLVEYLRVLYPDLRYLNKWEQIFKVYNGIVSAQSSIDQAVTQVTFSEDEGTQEVLNETEELQSSQGSSTEETVDSNFMNEPADMGEHVEETPQVTEEVEDTRNAATVNEEVAEDTSMPSEEVHAEPHNEVSVTTPTGSGNQDEVQAYSNKSTISNKEENTMANESVESLLDVAKKIGGNADPTKTQQAPGSNISKNKVGNETVQQVREMMAAEGAARQAWVRENFVTAIIATQQPAALRAIAQTGVPVPGETDAAKAKEALSAKLTKFIFNVSGKEGLTVEAFEALPDSEKYANVVVKEGQDNVGKAAAIYELYKQMLQNPLGEYGAYIDPSKVSYTTKGYMIGSTPYGEQGFIIELLDKGVGAIYAEGSMTADGKDASATATSFKVGLANRKESSKGTKVTTNTGKVTRVPVVRPKNKAAFIAGGQHIKFLFSQYSEETGSASFKAAIQHQGQVAPATVSVYALANGQKQVRSTQKNGEVTYKTKVASISVSVPVHKVEPEFGAEFIIGNEDKSLTAGRYGIVMKAKAAKSDFGHLETIGNAPMIDIFANIMEGNVNISKFGGSASIKAIVNAANANAEAEAQATATELE